MAPRDDIAELYKRVNQLEIDRERLVVTVMDEDRGLVKDVEQLKLWRDELKSLLNRWLGVWILVSFIAQIALPYILKALHIGP